jgi:rhomboid protease GluP
MRRTSGSMLCPNCRKLISVDEPRCPFCGTMRPGLWGYGPMLQRLFGPNMDLVPILMGACIVLYVAGLLLDLPGAMRPRGFMNILSPSGMALFRLGMTGGFPIGERWWTLLTAIYLHGGILHIFFNMWWLRYLIPNAQQVWGPARVFTMWSLTGAAGFLVSNLFGASFSIGASGSIFGLLGALLAYARRHRSSWGGIASRQMLQSVVFLLVLGFAMPGVNNLAHLGGLASGYLLGSAIPAVDERREKRVEQLLALGLAGLTILGFVLSWTQSSLVQGG